MGFKSSDWCLCKGKKREIQRTGRSHVPAEATARVKPDEAGWQPLESRREAVNGFNQEPNPADLLISDL